MGAVEKTLDTVETTLDTPVIRKSVHEGDEKERATLIMIRLSILSAAARV